MTFNKIQLNNAAMAATYIDSWDMTIEETQDLYRVELGYNTDQEVIAAYESHKTAYKIMAKQGYTIEEILLIAKSPITEKEVAPVKTKKTRAKKLPTFEQLEALFEAEQEASDNVYKEEERISYKHSSESYGVSRSDIRKRYNTTKLKTLDKAYNKAVKAIYKEMVKFSESEWNNLIGFWVDCWEWEGQ
jgi:hypothetical protein